MLLIGIHREERKNPQRLLVSLSVRVNEHDEKDNIGDTLDYDQIYHFLKDLENFGHFDLQETVCRKILEYVLVLPGVERVKVTTKKTDIFEDADYVGVTMSAQNIS